MTDNVVHFPTQESPDFVVGPFEEYRVVVEGRVIPRLSGRKNANGTVALIVDGRFGHDFPAEHAHQAAWLLANALAVGEGYPSINAPNKQRPFAPLVHHIVVPEGK